MCKERLVDIYGSIDQVVVRVQQHPREAMIGFCVNGKPDALHFANPNPVSALMDLLDDCWGIRVIDRNIKDGGQLEFGRYRVEFWDEDNLTPTFNVDAFVHSDGA